MSTVHRTMLPSVACRVTVTLAFALATAWAADDTPVTPPTGGGASVRLEAAPPPAATRRARSVFVCQADGIPAYSDRPCAPAAPARVLQVEVPRTAGAAVSTVPPAPRAAPRPASAPTAAAVAPRDAHAARCESLRRQLDDVDDRMRAGYSAREAARLWHRWREIKGRLRSAHC